MEKDIMSTVANMKVAEMRKVAATYGISNASKYKRQELEKKLVDAILAVVEGNKKIEKQANVRKKAIKVENDKVEESAKELMSNIKSMSSEQLFGQNRKVLIVVMKELHCKKWYRTYDKATMVDKILAAVA